MKILKKNNKVIFLLILFSIIIYCLDFVGVINTCLFDENNVYITTSRHKFLSIDRRIKNIQEIDGEVYLLLELSPEPIPPVGEIYRAAKCRKTIHVEVYDVFPKIKITISGGLYEDEIKSNGIIRKVSYIKVKCKSTEEAKYISTQLGL